MGHPIQELTGIPSLAEMEPIAGARELPQTLQLQNAFEMRRLPDFGMGFYRHMATETIWLGLDNPEVHDHDRWFLCVVPNELDQWYSVMLDAQLSGRAIIRGDLRLKTGSPSRDYVRNLVSRLFHAYDQYREAANRANRTAPDRARAAAYTRLLNGVKHAEIGDLGIEFSLREMHEMLYHYDEWAARNPEVEGMPREIVMRMHKLSFYGRYENTAAPVPS
jgi:hypothetical protein